MKFDVKASTGPFPLKSQNLSSRSKDCAVREPAVVQEIGLVNKRTTHCDCHSPSFDAGFSRKREPSRM